VEEEVVSKMGIVVEDLMASIASAVTLENVEASVSIPVQKREPLFKDAPPGHGRTSG
jgi:hypothetical protein